MAHHYDHAESAARIKIGTEALRETATPETERVYKRSERMSERMSKFSGSGTTADGKRVQLTSEQAEALWKGAEEDKAKRETSMPDTETALRALCDAKQRLRELGWAGGQYCPKDHSEFAAIEYGSSGIFSAFYEGEWPKGSIMICDGFTNPHGCMWKALDKLTDAERSKFDECVASERLAMDREARAFGADI